MRRIERRVERRRLRDAQNPFYLPRDKFIDCFRFSPQIVIDIANPLKADLQNERLIGLVPEIKITKQNYYIYNVKLIILKYN